MRAAKDYGTQGRFVGFAGLKRRMLSTNATGGVPSSKGDFRERQHAYECEKARAKFTTLRTIFLINGCQFPMAVTALLTRGEA
jgi:hypothetical protein